MVRHFLLSYGLLEVLHAQNYVISVRGPSATARGKFPDEEFGVQSALHLKTFGFPGEIVKVLTGDPATLEGEGFLVTQGFPEHRDQQPRGFR